MKSRSTDAEFKQRIARILRENPHIDQRKMSISLGMSPQAVNAFIRDGSRLSIANVQRIAEYINKNYQLDSAKFSPRELAYTLYGCATVPPAPNEKCVGRPPEREGSNKSLADYRTPWQTKATGGYDRL